MKRLVIAIAVALVLPTAAPAKEIVAAKVCGASECRSVEDEQDRMALQQGGAPTDPPEQRSPFYRAELAVGGDGERTFRFTLLLVPRDGLVRATGDDGSHTWMPVSPRAVERYRRMTRGIAPIPAARLDGLDATLPGARVDAVYQVAPEDSAGDTLWFWVVGGLVALAALAVAVALLVRRGWAPPGLRAVRSRP